MMNLSTRLETEVTNSSAETPSSLDRRSLLCVAALGARVSFIRL